MRGTAAQGSATRTRTTGTRTGVPWAVALAAGLALAGCSAGSDPAADGTEGATSAAVECSPDAGSPLVADGPVDPAALQLPEPTGQESVGTIRVALTDEGRDDPIAPSGGSRQLVAQVWYPTEASVDSPGCTISRYEGAAAAAANEQLFYYPEGSLDAVRSPALLGAPVATDDSGHPVVLYSPGLYGSFTDNTAVTLELASRGYVVVAVSTTHEAPAVEFPDGSVVGTSERASDLLGSDQVSPLIGLRAQDQEFVLDQLADGTVFPEQLTSALDLTAVGSFGHSAGGAAALQVAHDRDDVTAAVNLDGFARQPDAAEGLADPYLFVTSNGHSPKTEPTWPAFLAASGEGTAVEIAGAGHLALTDVGSDGWIDGLNLPATVPAPAFATNFGQLSPGTMSTIAEGVAAFFDRTLRDDDSRAGFAQLAQSRPDVVASITDVP